MKVRNSLRAARAARPCSRPSGATGGLQAVAPPGTVFTGLHADATAYDEKGSSGVDGWRAGIRVNGRTDVWCAFQHACSWIGPPTLRIDLPLFAASVQLAAICGLSTGCQRDRVRAATTLRNVTLDVRDDVPPGGARVRAATSGGAGPGCTAPRTLKIRGTRQRRRALARDRGRRQSVATRALPCDDYAMKPCPDDVSLESSFDTTRLPDGEATVVARAVDAGGQTVEERATVTVDNVAPTVGAPEVRGGSDWRATNAFELGLDPRDGPRGSGVRSVAWEVCRLDETRLRRGLAQRARPPSLGVQRARRRRVEGPRLGRPTPCAAGRRARGRRRCGSTTTAAGRRGRRRRRRAGPTGAGASNVVLSLPDDVAARAVGRRRVRRRPRRRRSPARRSRIAATGRSWISATCRRA